MSQFHSLPQRALNSIPGDELINLDFYMATDTRNIYMVLFNTLIPIGTFWPSFSNLLQGPAGPAGPTGPQGPAGSGGGGTLEDLTDVAIDSPTDGQVLTYVPASSSPVAPAKWVNQDAPTGFDAPAFPRAGAGPWLVWMYNGSNFTNTVQTFGSLGQGNFPRSNYCTYLIPQTDSFSVVRGSIAVDQAGVQYFKCRAALPNGEDEPVNSTFRLWIGLGYQTDSGAFNTDTPAQSGAAFRFSTDVDSTIKAVVYDPGTGLHVVDTGVPMDTNYHDYAISFTTDYITFFIDGTQVAQINSHFFALTSLSPFIEIDSIIDNQLSPPSYPRPYLFFKYLYLDLTS